MALLDWESGAASTVHTETWIVVKALLAVILLPFRAALAVFGRASWHDAVAPFVDLWAVLSEAKATLVLAGALVAGFAAQAGLPGGVVDRLVMDEGDLLSGVVHTVVTSSFLHANISHLVANVVALLVFGRVVERYFGPTGVIVSYGAGVVVGGAATQLVHAAIGDAWAALGASIGVSAVLAVAVLRDPFYISYVSPIPGPIALLGLLYVVHEASNVLVADGVAHLGHVFGVVTSVALAVVTGGLRRAWVRIGLAVLVALVSAAVIVVLLGSLF